MRVMAGAWSASWGGQPQGTTARWPKQPVARQFRFSSLEPPSSPFSYIHSPSFCLASLHFPSVPFNFCIPVICSFPLFAVCSLNSPAVPFICLNSISSLHCPSFPCISPHFPPVPPSAHFASLHFVSFNFPSCPFISHQSTSCQFMPFRLNSLHFSRMPFTWLLFHAFNYTYMPLHLTCGSNYFHFLASPFLAFLILFVSLQLLVSLFILFHFPSAPLVSFLPLIDIQFPSFPVMFIQFPSRTILSLSHPSSIASLPCIRIFWDDARNALDAGF